MTALEFFAIRQSLIVAFLSVLTVLPIVILLAYILTRFNFPGKILLETIVLFPLVLPPVVTGYLLLVLLKKQGLVGGLIFRLFGTEAAFSPFAAVAASSVIIFPLMLRPVKVSMESINPDLIKVSRGLGRNRVYTFLRIVLPLSLPGIIAGAVLGFARSIGEFGATIMVAGNIPFKTTTIPLGPVQLFQSCRWRRTGSETRAFQHCPFFPGADHQ